MIVELCATVILTDASPALWHIPRPGDRGGDEHRFRLAIQARDLLEGDA